MRRGLYALLPILASCGLLMDFEPGSDIVAASGADATGARHPSSDSTWRLSPYGSNSGAEYLDTCIGYQQ